MNKLTKILVPVLALALLLGAMIGVSASASGEPTTPEIASMNVEYSSQLYLYYAVPVIDDNGDGENDDVVLNVYKDAECQELLYSVNGTVETITALGGGSYYVYNTSGVAAKELNTCEYVQAVNTETGAKSEVVEYSVEQYLYTKLYDEGYALMTEEDGKEYVRRTLYYDLLKYGSTAQQLFTPEATDKIADGYIYKISNATATGGEIELGTDVVMSYVAPAGETKKFACWKYAVVSTFGDVIASGYAENGASLTAQGNVVAKPVYGAEANYIDFDDNTYDSNYFTEAPEATTGDNVTTTDIADGKYSVTKTANVSNSGASTYAFATTTNANANVTVVEFEMMFTGSRTAMELYFGPSSNPGKTNAYAFAYFSNSGTNLRMAVYDNHASGETKVIGTIGEVVNMRIEYYEGTLGNTVTKYYANDVLVHSGAEIEGTSYHTAGSGAVLDANAMATIKFMYGASSVGSLILDNIAITQTEIPECNLKARTDVVDFNAQSEKVTHTSDSYGTHSLVSDPVTGAGYYSINKVSGGGTSFHIAPTSVEDNATKAVVEFDMWVSSDATINVQTWMLQQEAIYKSSGYNWAPFLFAGQLNSKLVKGSWNTVKIEYLPTAFLADGAEADVFEANIYVNGALEGTVTTNRGAANIDIPKVSELVNLTFTFNSAAAGEFKIDNASFKLLAD
ncbi:MAG: hypothetical protein IJ459_03160 [Clostridia bacterium]|nr:hypothetical protein [Clostridia bacterium]